MTGPPLARGVLTSGGPEARAALQATLRSAWGRGLRRLLVSHPGPMLVGGAVQASDADRFHSHPPRMVGSTSPSPLPLRVLLSTVHGDLIRLAAFMLWLGLGHARRVRSELHSSD